MLVFEDDDHDHDPQMAAIAMVGEYPSPVRRSRPHYHDVNILGADFCHFHKFCVWNDYKSLSTKLCIGGNWEVTEISKQ
jgi:hypothetical protein